MHVCRRGVLSPPDLRNAALQRVTYAPAVLGSVELHRVVRVAPIWRPLLTALGRQVRVTWRNPGDSDVAWFAGELVSDPHPAPASPEIVSCASPRAEAVEALALGTRTHRVGPGAARSDRRVRHGDEGLG